MKNILMLVFIIIFIIFTFSCNSIKKEKIENKSRIKVIEHDFPYRLVLIDDYILIYSQYETGIVILDQNINK